MRHDTANSSVSGDDGHEIGLHQRPAVGRQWLRLDLPNWIPDYQHLVGVIVQDPQPRSAMESGPNKC